LLNASERDVAAEVPEIAGGRRPLVEIGGVLVRVPRTNGT